MAFSYEELKAYLLGTASETETERFDELSITSADFADGLAAAEFDLVDSYACGELSAQDRERFEQRYLTTSSGRLKVRFAEAFEQHAAKNASKATAAPEMKVEERTSTDSFFVSAIRYFRWGFAVAATALLVFFGWLYFGGQGGDEISKNSNSQNESPIPISNASVGSDEQPEIAQRTNNAASNESTQNNLNIAPRNTKPPSTSQSPISRVFAFSLSPPLRSSNSLPAFSIPTETSRVSVRLELESESFRSYRVSLIGPSNNQVWQSTVRPTNGPGGMSIIADLPSTLLRPGVFRFSVTGIGPKGEAENIGDYPFRIVQ